jgi:hypothetical protein
VLCFYQLLVLLAEQESLQRLLMLKRVQWCYLFFQQLPLASGITENVRHLHVQLIVRVKRKCLMTKLKPQTKIELRIIIVISFLILFVATGLKAQRNKPDMNIKSKDKVVCKLTTSQLQKRKATVIADLKAHVLSRRELDSGYSYKFEATDDILDKLNMFIKTERLCCSFFTFQLTVNESNAILNITGPAEAKELLKLEVDL